MQIIWNGLPRHKFVYKLINTNIKQELLGIKSERLKEQQKQVYKEPDQTVKQPTRRDKRKYLHDIATQAEEAAHKGDQATLYNITKQVCGQFRKNLDAPIKGKDGKLLISEETQDARPPPETEPHNPVAVEDLEIETSTPSKEEIINAIKALKNNKAPGPDNLNAELFKTDPAIAAEIPLPLMMKVWEDKRIPDDWNEATIIRIPKKGALNDCNNWRGITLLSIPSKILAKISINRLSNAVDSRLREEQAGCRKGKGCIDQTFALRNIIEQGTEWQRKLHINFVDFKKAFDSIHRNSLWKILRHYGIPQEIVSIIQSFYNNFNCRVGNNQHSFPVLSRVRQGCVMSALLFNITIDWVMRPTTQDKNRGKRCNLFTNLDELNFADDLALLSHTHSHIQEKANRLHFYAKQVGLKINKRKIEVMTLNVQDPAPVKVEEDPLPYTDQFTYLGSTVRHDAGAGSDIINRIGKARNALRMLSPVWKSQQYKTHTKLKLYKSCVLSTLLYGSECWRMTEKDISKLSSFHTKNR